MVEPQSAPVKNELQLRLHNRPKHSYDKILAGLKNRFRSERLKRSVRRRLFGKLHKFRNSFVQGSLWLYYGIPLFKKFNMAIPIIYRALGIKTGRNSTDFIDTEFTCQSDSDNKKGEKPWFLNPFISFTASVSLKSSLEDGMP